MKCLTAKTQKHLKTIRSQIRAYLAQAIRFKHHLSRDSPAPDRWLLTSMAAPANRDVCHERGVKLDDPKDTFRRNTLSSMFATAAAEQAFLESRVHAMHTGICICNMLMGSVLVLLGMRCPGSARESACPPLCLHCGGHVLLPARGGDASRASWGLASANVSSWCCALHSWYRWCGPYQLMIFPILRAVATRHTYGSTSAFWLSTPLSRAFTCLCLSGGRS